MLPWLRRTLVTGFFVTVPLAVSLFAVVWAFRLIDGMTRGFTERIFGASIPGLGIAMGVVMLLIVGTLARNIMGRRLLAKGEELLMHVPFFSTVYSPVKQLLAAFSPDNEYGFKHVVLVHHPVRGSVLGFLTKEFSVESVGAGAAGAAGAGASVDAGALVGAEPPVGDMVAVYVPTNHLYLGDIVIRRRSELSFPDLTVEQGIRIFLTGGMALPDKVRTGHERD
jgi:uncharacterized membrane protein